ncbi:LysE family transporter [Pseudomonas sp. HK3]
MDYWASLLMGFMIAAIPGPLILKLMQLSLNKKFSKAFAMSLGDYLANIALLLIIYNMVIALDIIQNYINIFYLIGAIILFYLAFDGFTSSSSMDVDLDAPKSVGTLKYFTLGIGMALFSPIVITFWISLSISYSELETHEAQLNIIMVNNGFLLFDILFIGLVRYCADNLNKIYNQILVNLSSVALLGFGSYFIYMSLELF